MKPLEFETFRTKNQDTRGNPTDATYFGRRAKVPGGWLVVIPEMAHPQGAGLFSPNGDRKSVV